MSTNGLLQPSSWRAAWTKLRTERTHSRIIGGSLVMLIGSGLVSAVNFGYNVAVARLLGPRDFGNAAAAVTLLMLVSAITLAFQIVCAKFVARNETAGAKSAVYGTLMRRAWFVGVTLGLGLVFFSRPTAAYLHMPSPVLVVLLALGIAFYVPLGVKRGGLQGICSFHNLTLNFIIEAVVKFVGAIVLIRLGFGVRGAVAAIAASVITAFFLPLSPSELAQPREAGQPASFREGMQAIVFFVGQVIINNIDILLVKHFFPADQAGLYAAVALVGRVVYFFSWSVMSAMFPISAQSKPQDDDSSVLVVPLLLVLAIAVIFAFGLGAFPESVLGLIFGHGFNAAAGGRESLLMLYAAATGAYSLAVVLMAYEMSRKLANSAWIQLGFSGAIMLGIALFHSNLKQVIVVQLVLMVVLFIAAAVPFFRPKRRPAVAGFEELSLATAAAPTSSMRRIRRVHESEVIAEFLRCEYYHAEFERDRDRFLPWVVNPDLSDHSENALRRALLFRRREGMWRELPPDTEWWEVEMSPRDLQQVRVFPRAQWRKLASGSFLLTDIVRRVHATQTSPNGDGPFIGKLRSLSEHLRAHDDRSGVMLIGIDEKRPLTIIEGNHRLTAAMLASPELPLQRFRYYCGFSPRMNECCWYQTNFINLSRYARNRIRVLLYDREAEIARIMTQHDSAANMAAFEATQENTNESSNMLERKAS